MKHFQEVVVTGPIAAGKETLVKGLAKEFDAFASYESVEDNPYLSLFYNDPVTWAFRLQVWQITDLVRKTLYAQNHKRSVIETSFYSSAFVFPESLHRNLILTQDERDIVVMLGSIVNELIEPPDLIIRLKATPEVLKERVDLRGRSMELGNALPVTIEYLESLSEEQDRWAYSDNCPRCEVVTIDTTRMVPAAVLAEASWNVRHLGLFKD